MLLFAGTILGLYVIASYYLSFRDLKRSPGPAGLGWLAFPLAPLMGPLLIAAAVQGFFRRVFS